MIGKTTAQNLITEYLLQGERYYSQSKDELIAISEMPPAYAANAASKMMRDAKFWAEDAGFNLMSIVTYEPIKGHAETLLGRCNVYRALLARAESGGPDVLLLGALRLNKVRSNAWREGL